MNAVDRAYDKVMRRDITNALSVCGFQPSTLIGKIVVFGDVSEGIGVHFAGGTIMSFGYADKEGLRLYTTIQRFKGKDIKRFEQRDNIWVAISTKNEVVNGVLVFY